MNIISDYVIVKVDSELNTFAGLIKDDKGNEIELVLNPNFRPTHHSKICAVVASVPSYLTGKDNPLYEIYQGAPRPTTYRGHDYVKSVMDSIPKKYQKKQKIPYQCGGYAPMMQTIAGMPVEVRVGDKVYFHYNSLLNEENYLWRDEDGMLVYKILYSNLFCYIRDQEIHMLNSYILVSEIYDEESKEIDRGDGVLIRAKTKGDLVVSVVDRPLYLSGKLEHIGKGIGPMKRSTRPGTLVMFRPSSEFINMIEGEPFYVMRQWDIIAEWMNKQEIDKIKSVDPRVSDAISGYDWLSPAGDYLLVKPDQIQLKEKTKVYDPNKMYQDFEPGEIFVLADSVKDNKKKKIHSFGVGNVISSGNICPDKYTGKKIYYEKGSYYVWIEEYQVALVRYGDVFGSPIESKILSI
jgi:co-chaperonin GroES (HSP10)